MKKMERLIAFAYENYLLRLDEASDASERFSALQQLGFAETEEKMKGGNGIE